MCGICVAIEFNCDDQLQLDKLIASVARRGPDSLHTLRINRGAPPLANLTITSSVLSLRGESLSEQPATKSGNIFCWNGEAWQIGGIAVEGPDTPRVAEILHHVKADLESHPQGQRISQFAAALSTVTGPFAFFYYDQATGLAFFGRDSLGRRSLLYCFSASSSLIVSSVTSKEHSTAWTECQPGCIYVVNLNGEANSSSDFIEATAASAENQRYTKIKYTQAIYGTLDHDLGNLGHAFVDSPVVQTLETELIRSLRFRVLNIRSPGTKLAILFSGGLDCSLLAALIDRILPLSEEIDLLNVAFQNPRVEAGLKKAFTEANETGIDIFSHCPDRITGQAAYKELCTLSKRKWNFVEIDVSYSEYLAHRPQVIDLMYPHNTEMDLSIASAFYFAARGKGHVQLEQDNKGVGRGQPERTEYTTSARVLISGLGADELFGGYTRHLAAFQRGGHDSVLKELEFEIERLPHRNLGRDDRVLSYWGQEARYPFLDEEFVRFARSLPVETRCGFGLESATSTSSEYSFANGQAKEKGEDVVTEPGKRLLRLLAWNLGLRRPAGEKKRAIQFGARTAKMEGGKTKGHHEIA